MRIEVRLYRYFSGAGIREHDIVLLHSSVSINLAGIRFRKVSFRKVDNSLSNFIVYGKTEYKRQVYVYLKGHCFHYTSTIRFMWPNRTHTNTQLEPKQANHR